MVNKLALCFLLYDTVEHVSVWEKFLHGNDDKYNLYSHPKVVTEDTPGWIIQSKIRTIKTGWCDESLVFAFLKMVKKGMEDRTNKYFCIVSGTCVPLHDFDNVYNKVFKNPQSRMNFVSKKYSHVFEGETHHPHSQWMILNRKQSQDALRLMDKTDTKAQTFLREIRNKYRTHRRNGTWYSYCMDELYLGEWFIRLYGSTNSVGFRKQIKQGATTFVEFDKWDSDHPILFKRKDMTKKKLKQIKHGSLFGRKFTSEAVNKLLET